MEYQLGGGGVRHSEKLGELMKALIASQSKFNPVKKSKKANFPTKRGYNVSYTFAGLDDVIDMYRPVLAEHGLCILQPPTNPNDGWQDVTTILYHADSEQWISSTERLALSSNDDPQVIGKCITYLRRYSVSGLLNISTEQDDDGAAAAGGSQTAGKTPVNKKTSTPVESLTSKEMQDVADILRIFQEKKLDKAGFEGIVGSIKMQSEAVQNKLRKPATEYKSWLKEQRRKAEDAEQKKLSEMDRTPVKVVALTQVGPIEPGDKLTVSRVVDGDSVVVETNKEPKTLRPNQYRVLQWSDESTDQSLPEGVNY